MADLAAERAILRLRGIIDLEVEISGKYRMISCRLQTGGRFNPRKKLARSTPSFTRPF